MVCFTDNFLKYVSDLPPHQEIGMPSLSPTMTEACTSEYLLRKLTWFIVLSFY